MDKDLRKKRFSIPVTEAEYEQINQRAELMGIPTARLARDLIFSGRDFTTLTKQINLEIIDKDTEPKIRITLKLKDIMNELKES